MENLISDEMLRTIITAVVGLIVTAFLALVTAATEQLRQWLKAKKLNAFRGILDEMIANAKRGITPQVIAGGQIAVSDYLFNYIKTNGTETIKKLNANDEQLRNRTNTEASAVIKVSPRLSVPGASPTGGVLYPNAESGG